MARERKRGGFYIKRGEEKEKKKRKKSICVAGTDKHPQWLITLTPSCSCSSIAYAGLMKDKERLKMPVPAY